MQNTLLVQEKLETKVSSNPVMVGGAGSVRPTMPTLMMTTLMPTEMGGSPDEDEMCHHSCMTTSCHTPKCLQCFNGCDKGDDECYKTCAMTECPSECGQCHIQCHCKSKKAEACKDCTRCEGREHEAECAPCVERCSSYAVCLHLTTPDAMIGGPGPSNASQSLQARFGNLESRVTRLEMQPQGNGPACEGRDNCQAGWRCERPTDAMGHCEVCGSYPGHQTDDCKPQEPQEPQGNGPFPSPAPGGPSAQDMCHRNCMQTECGGGCLDCMKDCTSEDCAEKCIMGRKCSNDCKQCHLNCQETAPPQGNGPTGAGFPTVPPMAPAVNVGVPGAGFPTVPPMAPAVNVGGAGVTPMTNGVPGAGFPTVPPMAPGAPAVMTTPMA